jgi:hypothetical protein
VLYSIDYDNGRGEFNIRRPWYWRRVIYIQRLKILKRCTTSVNKRLSCSWWNCWLKCLEKSFSQSA